MRALESMRRLVEPSRNQRQLLDALREALAVRGRIPNTYPLQSPFEYEAGPQYESAHVSAPTYVLGLLDELDHLVREAPKVVEVPELESGELWSLGCFQHTADTRWIYGGFVEPVLNIPMRVPLSDKLTAFLIAIGGDRDLLKREHHDRFGWHYHYLDFKKKRSDVILCFDRYATVGDGLPQPLFWEGHGEGRSDFKARPAGWGTAKRQSMHEACTPDLKKWAIGTFKNASREALAVWPNGATLTPRLGASVSARSASGGRKR